MSSVYEDEIKPRIQEIHKKVDQRYLENKQVVGTTAEQYRNELADINDFVSRSKTEKNNQAFVENVDDDELYRYLFRMALIDADGLEKAEISNALYNRNPNFIKELDTPSLFIIMTYLTNPIFKPLINSSTDEDYSMLIRFIKGTDTRTGEALNITSEDIAQLARNNKVNSFANFAALKNVIMVRLYKENIDLKRQSFLDNDDGFEAVLSKLAIKSMAEIEDYINNIRDDILAYQSYIYHSVEEYKVAIQKITDNYIKAKNCIHDILNDDTNQFDVSYTMEELRKAKFDKLFLEVIYLTNLLNCQATEEELDTLMSKDDLMILDTFAKLHIDLTQKDVEDLLSKGKNTIKNIISLAQEMSVHDENALLYLAKNATVCNMKSLREPIRRGYIVPEWLEKNPEIACPGTTKSENFLKNFETLKKLGIDLKNTEITGIVLEDCEGINNNIEALEQYNLLDSLRQTEVIRFLTSSELTDRLDILLEQGFEKEIEANLDLLNYDTVRYKRIALRGIIGKPVTTREELVEILEKDMDLVPDEELDEYLTIYSKDASGCVQPHELCKPVELNRFSNSDRTYLIGGQLISKPKVARYYTNNKGSDNNIVFNSVINNLPINDRVYSKIKKAIK